MTRIFSLICLFVCLVAALKHKEFEGHRPSPNPDVRRNVTEIIIAKGYVCEEHTVTTKDGYQLYVQRIPESFSGKKATKGPIILQHGLLDSAYTWVVNNKDQSLPYLLADAGYDVWLGNSRGNRYGIRHVSLSPDSREFWEFSWDEMAEYDMPALVDFALATSGAKDLYWVGHSQGTMMAFAALSTNKALATKVRKFFALAPVATIGHVRSPLLQAIGRSPEFLDHIILGHKGTMMDENALVPICKFLPEACDDGICLLAGCEAKQNVNQTVLPVLFSHFPAGTSAQNMIHYSQAIKSDLFGFYDFGKKGNLAHYNQTQAPLHPLQGFATRLVMFSGTRDRMADPTDVATLLKMLPSAPEKHFVIDDYGHGDFVWGLDSAQKIYHPLMNLLD